MSGKIVATPEIVPEKIVPVDMAMISLAIEKGAGIETIERLVALQEKLLDRQAEIEFNAALNQVQKEITRVAPDLMNKQTNSKYASYAAIDHEIRPIYTRLGMSVSFTEEDCPKAEHVRIVAYVTKGAYTRKYRKDMPADGKGAKGGDVMTKTHAAAAADSYAKRYLIKDIFNIAIGEEDRDGNDLMPENQEQDFLIAIGEAKNKEEMDKAYKAALAEGLKQQDSGAVKLFVEARKKRAIELQEAQ